jgi:vacuolar-type H+-ATPase subunit I/STV1
MEVFYLMFQEGDGLRKQVVEVHGERITSVQRARQENGEELEKIKEKLHEVWWW